MLTDVQFHQIARDKLSRSILSTLEKTAWKDGIDVAVLRTEALHLFRAIESAVRAELMRGEFICHKCGIRQDAPKPDVAPF